MSPRAVPVEDGLFAAPAVDVVPTAEQRAADDASMARRARAASLLEDLNDRQRDAVQHRGAPLLIVAGAGSGKTRVLTRRIAYLLAAGGATPGEILAITFTNKAAAEMRERVGDLVGARSRAMWVSTFHSMCVRILRNEATQLGYRSSFTIYDSADSQRLVALVANDLELDPKKFAPKSIAAQISNLKNELIDPATAADRADNDIERTVADVYARYQARLKGASALDFDDLIMETVALLQAFPAVAEHYRRRFRHVLVDEYQDTNHAQYMLVKELVGTADPDDPKAVAPAELVVVGDADQSIYAFRGATIRNIVEFERDYPDARTILLEQNYRSTQNILSAANAVIARNPGRRAKSLWTASGSGEPIVGYVADNEYDEASFVCGEIDRLVDAGEIRFGDVAVFYRTNSSSRAFEDIFVRLGMPYKIVGGVRFYERREVKDALAYLRALANPADEVSLRRIMNVPKRGIGDRAEASIAVFAANERIPFAEAMTRVREIPFLVARSVNAIESFNTLIAGLRELLADGMEPADLLSTVLERSGYLAELENSADPQDAPRVENLEQLVTVLRERAELLQQGEDEYAPGIELLSAVLEQLSLVADADQIPDSDAGVVTLMTLHTAKGLEFPVVFLTGWEDGLFPHMRALTDEKELAEERRLAYVGITRSQQRLYVSRAAMRSNWGQPGANPPSRFLDDIPPELMDWRRLVEAQETDWTRSAPVSAGRFGDRGDRGGRYQNASSESAQTRIAAGGMRSTGFKGWQNKPALVLAVGDRVSHDKYGLGKVVASDGSGVRATATIDFGAAGTVRLMLIGGVPMTKL
nr:DNA helicase PcrA [Nakamurella deserti]